MKPLTNEEINLRTQHEAIIMAIIKMKLAAIKNCEPSVKKDTIDIKVNDKEVNNG